MINKKLIESIIKNAAELTQKHILVKETAQGSDRQAWEKAAQDFHHHYNRLAFPGGLKEALNLLKQNDPATIEVAIVYLEADPYFHRSGYIKQQIARLLKQSILSEQNILQIQAVLLQFIQQGRGRQEHEYNRLAKKIKTPAFIESLQEIVRTTKEAGTSRRAKNMLAILLG